MASSSRAPQQTSGSGIVVALVVVAGVMLGGVAWWTSSVIAGDRSDILADWIVTKAAQSGIESDGSVLDLARRLEVEYLGQARDDVALERVHPRTPGAIAVLTPITLVPWPMVYQVWLAANALGIALLGGLALVFVPSSRRVLPAAVLALAMLSVPVWRSLEFGAQTAWLALVVWLYVRATWTDQTPWMAAGLGVAIAMRLFPALLLIPAIVHRRWRLVSVAASVALVLSGLGLVYPGVDLARSIQTLAAAGAQWGGFRANGSLAAGLLDVGIPWRWAAPSAVIGGVLAVAFLSRRVSFVEGTVVAVWMAVVVSPLSWNHYDLFLLPVVMILVGSRSHLIRALALGPVALWVASRLLPSAGVVHVGDQTGFILLGRACVGLALCCGIKANVLVSRRDADGRIGDGSSDRGGAPRRDCRER